MSNLMTQVNSAAAASAARAAARDARLAREASEERLEGNMVMIVLQDSKFESVANEVPSNPTFMQRMFGTGSKSKLVPTVRVSLKKSDISHMTEAKDGFGLTYTVVHLEDRCNLDQTEIYVPGSIEETTNTINSF